MRVFRFLSLMGMVVFLSACGDGPGKLASFPAQKEFKKTVNQFLGKITALEFKRFHACKTDLSDHRSFILTQERDLYDVFSGFAPKLGDIRSFYRKLAEGTSDDPSADSEKLSDVIQHLKVFAETRINVLQESIGQCLTEKRKEGKVAKWFGSEEVYEIYTKYFANAELGPVYQKKGGSQKALSSELEDELNAAFEQNQIFALGHHGRTQGVDRFHFEFASLASELSSQIQIIHEGREILGFRGLGEGFLEENFRLNEELSQLKTLREKKALLSLSVLEVLFRSDPKTGPAIVKDFTSEGLLPLAKKERLSKLGAILERLGISLPEDTLNEVVGSFAELAHLSQSKENMDYLVFDRRPGEQFEVDASEQPRALRLPFLLAEDVTHYYDRQELGVAERVKKMIILSSFPHASFDSFDEPIDDLEKEETPEQLAHSKNLKKLAEAFHNTEETFSLELIDLADPILPENLDYLEDLRKLAHLEREGIAEVLADFLIGNEVSINLPGEIFSDWLELPQFDEAVVEEFKTENTLSILFPALASEDRVRLYQDDQTGEYRLRGSYRAYRDQKYKVALLAFFTKDHSFKKIRQSYEVFKDVHDRLKGARSWLEDGRGVYLLSPEPARTFQNDGLVFLNAY